MGIIAASPGIATGAGPAGFSTVTAVGASVGSVYAAAALVFTLAYLDLLRNSDREEPGLYWTLVASVVALGFVFTSFVVFVVRNVVVSSL